MPMTVQKHVPEDMNVQSAFLLLKFSSVKSLLTMVVFLVGSDVETCAELLKMKRLVSILRGSQLVT